MIHAIANSSPRRPFIYFVNEGHPCTVVEMADATPTRIQVREAAPGDPMRRGWPKG